MGAAYKEKLKNVFKGNSVDILIKEDEIPIFHKARPVPYALWGAVEKN